MTLFTCRTDGKGLWSRTKKTVPIIRLELDVTQWDDRTYGELRAYFKMTSWNTKSDGLIYTDKLWMFEFREALRKLGYTQAAVDDIEYSEQGMQSIDYVSLDVEADFIKECDALYRFANGQDCLAWQDRLPAIIITESTVEY